MPQLYTQQVRKLKRAPVGRITYIDVPPTLDPKATRNMLSVTANKLWGARSAAVRRDGRTIAVCRFPH